VALCVACGRKVPSLRRGERSIVQGWGGGQAGSFRRELTEGGLEGAHGRIASVSVALGSTRGGQ